MACVTATRELQELDPSARAKIEELLSKEWALPGEHALAALQGRELGPYRLIVVLGPKNNVGSQYFQVFLANGEGALADEPLALGLHNSGPYPGFNWVELTRYNSTLAFGGEIVDLTEGDLDRELFGMVSELVPPGGHLMVEYDSPSQAASAQALTRGLPAATSPIGFRMFQAGCRSYRDWYIPEGGREGPRKLQGFKPWNEEIAREKTAALRGEIEAFVRDAEGAEGDAVQRRALERAREVLKGLAGA
jgi:hypothetical protein